MRTTSFCSLLHLRQFYFVVGCGIVLIVFYSSFLIDSRVLVFVAQADRPNRSVSPRLATRINTSTLIHSRRPQSITSSEWFLLPDKMTKLMDNHVYSKYNISRALKPEQVNLVLFVLSAPKRKERRDASRETWWQHCRSTDKVSVRCFFVTDYIDPLTEQGKALVDEQAEHGDMIFQRLESGIIFGDRFLYHMIWAMQNYDFDYFMRLDDDMFLCVDRFLHELPMPPVRFYHWGWVHCLRDIVRPEESIILLSRDVIIAFLGQHPDAIMCHPWADQMIGTWSEEMQLQKFYHHDPRIHHSPPANFLPEFDSKTDICQNYMAVHGSYPRNMRTLWKNRGADRLSNSSLTDHANFCSVPHRFQWNLFYPPWKYEPKRCVKNPTWDTSAQTSKTGTYGGRQGERKTPSVNHNFSAKQAVHPSHDVSS